MTSQIHDQQVPLVSLLSPDAVYDMKSRFKTACHDNNEQELAMLVTQIPNIVAEAGSGRSSLYYCYAIKNLNLKLVEKLLWFGFPLLDEDGKLSYGVHKMMFFDMTKLGAWDIELLDLLVGFGWDPWKSWAPGEARAVREAAESNQFLAEWVGRNKPPDSHVEVSVTVPVRRIPTLFREQLHNG